MAEKSKSALEVRDRITAIRQLRLGQIADNPRNPKTHPARQGETLQGVVREVGWAGVPLVYPSERLGGKLAFVDGHLRKREFPDLKVRVAVTDLTDEEADYLLLTYDPIASLAQVEKEKMASLLADVETGEAAVMEMLAGLAKDVGLEYGGNGAGAKEDPGAQIDRAEELREKWGVKSGDLWRLGEHRLICGDCTDAKVVERVMGGERADLLFTSPPYADAREYDGQSDLSINNLSRFFGVFNAYVDLFAINLGIIRKEYKVIRYWDSYIESAENLGLNLISWNVWNRETAQSIAQQTATFPIEHEFIFIFANSPVDLNKTIPNKHAGKRVGVTDRQPDGTLKKREHKLVGRFRKMGTVFTSPPHKGSDIGHPAMFPVDFPAAYIEACTDSNAIVVDPFCGSGTTIIACERLHRRCRAVEISPAYVAVSLERWHVMTGQDPVLLSS